MHPELMIFLFFLPSAMTNCPQPSNMSLSTYYVLSTDAYQSASKTAVHDVCRLHFAPVDSGGFIVSITHFFLFSHRQPKNTNEIIIRSKEELLVIKPESKIYKYFEGAIEIEMPMNLNFRALLILTVTKNCSTSETFRCLSNTTICVSRDYLCDENDNCGEEVNCSETKKPVQLTSFTYDQNALSSSQLMLIGFFLVNLAFIVFFLTLSLCSAGYCFSSKFYVKQSIRSRRTFAKYIREAARETPRPTPILDRSSSIDKAASPPSRKVSGERRHRPSILSRINFEPAPSLREYEPEIEDRTSTSPMQSPLAELCAPPIHRPEVFLRRQTLPSLYPTTKNSKKKQAAWKRSSVGGGGIV